MEKRDYYDVLGVERGASEADLKAYRRLAMKFHPDHNSDDPQAEEEFKEATEAYEILTDEEKRAAYDRFGHAGVDPNQGGGFGGQGNFGDIFGDVFGDIWRWSWWPQRSGTGFELTLQPAIESRAGCQWRHYGNSCSCAGHL